MSKEIMMLSITSQVGGPDAKKLARESIRQLAITLRDLKETDGIVSIEEIRLRTRVGGSIENYEEDTGIHNVKVLKRYDYATAEIIINQKDLTDEKGFHILYTKLIAQALDELKLLMEKKEVLLDADKYDTSIRDAIMNSMKEN